jgi:hypothetical protein
MDGDGSHIIASKSRSELRAKLAALRADERSLIKTFRTMNGLQPRKKR